MKYRIIRLGLFLFMLVIIISNVISASTEKSLIVEESLSEDIFIEEIDEEAGDIVVIDKIDIDIIARTLYGECRGVATKKEKAGVAWVVLNRIDAGYGETILEVVSSPNQFVGYDPSHPLEDELMSIAEDVLIRWEMEKRGHVDVGRVIPPDYLWFTGNGRVNNFRNEYAGESYWDWSLENPYID